MRHDHEYIRIGDSEWQCNQCNSIVDIDGGMVATALLRSQLRHPDYTPARERMNQWDDYHCTQDPDR